MAGGQEDKYLRGWEVDMGGRESQGWWGMGWGIRWKVARGWESFTLTAQAVLILMADRQTRLKHSFYHL